MKNFLAVVGFVACLIFGGLLLVGGLAHSSSSPTAPSLTNETPTASSFTIDLEGKRYTGATASNVGVVVTGVASSPVLLDGFQAERSDGKFVTVQVAVTNNQRDAITMNSSLFELISPDGLKYSSSSHSLMIRGNQNLFLAQLNPGITKVGIIVFDVPQNVDVTSLQLQFRGGMTGDEATIPLRVSAMDLPPLRMQPESVPETVETPATAAPSDLSSEPTAAAPEPRPAEVDPPPQTTPTAAQPND